MLRPSLVPGMLAMIAGNLHRDVSDVRLFELGTVFSGAGRPALQKKWKSGLPLAFGAAGSLPEEGPLHPPRAIDFHDLKGVVEQVLARFQARDVVLRSLPGGGWAHARMAASLPRGAGRGGWRDGGLVRAAASAPRPRAASSRSRRWWASCISTGSTSLPLRKPIAREISRFQPVRRDFSLVLVESIGWEKIDHALAELRIPELVDWRVREVFRDAADGRGRVFAAAGNDFSGCRSHPARGRVAELSGARGGSSQQCWREVEKLAREKWAGSQAALARRMH